MARSLRVAAIGCCRRDDGQWLPARIEAVRAVHHLSRAEARRLAIRAQMLDARRTADLLAVVRHLNFLQLDPTAAIAPSADLVAWARLGDSYRPEYLTRALEDDRTLFELRAFVRPMADLGLHLAEMASRSLDDRQRSWMDANDSFRRDVLAVLRERGPVLSRDVPDTSVVPWTSTGWTGNRNVSQMLEFLNARGEVAVAGRRGRQRLWDLPERVYPPDVEPVPIEEALRIRAERRLRALAIIRPAVVGVAGVSYEAEGTGEPAVVNGIEGEWRVDPNALGLPFEGRTALLSPFDRLVHDRVRAQELFDFEYYLEMYKPKEKRRWGYYALPILHEDRLVGKLDATADRKRSLLRVDAIHEDIPFSRTVAAAVDAEIEALASWLGLGSIVR